MPLRLYADECIDARVVDGLRRRGLDVSSAAEQNLLGADDTAHAERAKSVGRVIITADVDFLALPLDRGLIFMKPGTGVGDAIRKIVLLATALSPADIEHRIEWV